MPSVSEIRAARTVRLERLGLSEADFEEKFARSSGPGGQHVNKVSTAVTLLHRPTSLAVTVQDTRSQSVNRQLAWTRLLDAIERARHKERAAKRSAAEKERRSKAKRPWGIKQRVPRVETASCGNETAALEGLVTLPLVALLCTGSEIVTGPDPSTLPLMPGPAPKPIQTEELPTLAQAVIQRAKFPMLATVDGSQARVRPVSPVRVDGFTIFVANLRSYHKTQEIAASPQVELCYLDEAHDQVRITGIAEVLSDRILLEEIWNGNPLLRRYLGSIDNPELIVYRIRPSRVRFMREWALEYHEVPLPR